MTGETRRLYRSRRSRMISGVAGGIGEYYGIDPTIVRILLLLGLLMTTGPFAPLIYAVLVWLIPEEPA